MQLLLYILYSSVNLNTCQDKTALSQIAEIERVAVIKDLKYLQFFENLLLSSDNELVRKYSAEGNIVIGTTCAQLPEVLLNLPGCTCIRLRAPGTTSLEIGTYYMTSLNCEYCRAILERCVEGGYNYLDCIFDAYACSQMADTNDNIDKLGLCGKGKPKFFLAHVDTPIKANENAVRHLTRMCRERVLNRLHEEFSVDVSDEALLKAVEEHNTICRLINEIGSYRKSSNPTISGYEFAVFCLATYCCPHSMIIDTLRETAEELRTRVPDIKSPYRARVILAGSEADDPEFVKLIESCGAYVAADRHCFGSFPGRTEILLKEGEDILTQICCHYVMHCQCPRYMDKERIKQRKEYLSSLAREYNADGVIVQQMNFCNFWPYERAAMAHILPEEYSLPVLSVDRPYIVGNSGQMRTRIQAFVESLEIKKLRKEA